RSALAVVDDDGGLFTLLVWRVGERLRTYRHIYPLERFEVVRDVLWSPDDQRLLVLGPYGMGEGDQGFGRLWCLRQRDGRLFLLADASVTRAKWIGPTRIRYWTGAMVPDRKNPGMARFRETLHQRRCP